MSKRLLERFGTQDHKHGLFCFICYEISDEFETKHFNLTRHTSWNVSSNPWNYLMYPFGKEAVEGVLKKGRLNSEGDWVK